MGELREITGVGTALVTPFQNGKLDLASFERVVESQIEGGVDFLVPCGTTGESPTVTDEERITVIERTVDVAAGRVPVVAGSGTNDTPHSVAMTRAARQAGADACMAVVPYYNKPTQEGIYRHFRAMIDEGGLPAVLYHIPGRCVVGIDVDTIARTHEAGGVIGLKETATIARVTQIRAACDIPVLSGDDGITFPLICLGGQGVVSVASNVVPSLVAGLVRAARAGDVEEARQRHEALTPLFEALFVEPNPIPVKAAAQILGLVRDAEVRLPMTPATEATRHRLETALAGLGAAV